MDTFTVSLIFVFVFSFLLGLVGLNPITNLTAYFLRTHQGEIEKKQ